MKIKPILVLVLFVLTAFNTIGSLTIYEGVEFYGNKITLTFQSGTTIRYLEIGDNYFLLDELNLSISCSNDIATNVSAVNSTGNNLSSDTTVLRFNATYGSGNVVFTFTGNHTATIYNLYIDNTFSDIYEAESFSWSYNSWSEHDFEIEFAGYRPDPPYNGSSVYNTTTNALNLSWDRGNYSDREIVTKKTDSYPTSPSDGTEVQNGTETTYNESSVFLGAYYTVWSYNDTTGYFSATGLNIPWGALGITVYNESNPSQQISPFGLLISDQGGTETYQNSSCIDTHYLDLLSIPYGVNTIFVINATDYVDRTYYKDLYLNNFYNFSFYLPPFETPVDPGGGDPGGSGENASTTQDYIVTIIDELNDPVQGAKVIFKRYINTTESWEEIASGIADGYGQVPVSLIPGVLYKVDIIADDYQDSIGNDWIPKYIEFSDDRYKTFQILFEETMPQPPDVEPETILFEGYISGDNILYINYTDSLAETINTSIFVYEINLSTGIETLFGTNTTTNISSFQTSFSDINTSNTYKVILFYNHTTFGSQSKTLLFSGDYSPPAASDVINTLLTAIIGLNPFGWANFLIWLFLVAGMYYADERDSGKILVLLGGLFLFLNIVVGFNTTLMSIAGGAVPILFILVGILTMWRDSNKRAVA